MKINDKGSFFIISDKSQNLCIESMDIALNIIIDGSNFHHHLNLELNFI